MKVLVIGAGAIGGFYGSLLAKQGAEVAVICRSDYQQVRQHGFTIKSNSLGEWQFKPALVLQHIDDYKETADYILLCTKVIPGLDRVELIKKAVKPETSIVFIQNGVEIEQELLTAFPDNEIVSGLAFICSNRIGPGVISHLAYGRLTLGNIPGSVSNKTQALADAFHRSGIKCQTSHEIIKARWQKCVWNAPFNPLSVLSDGLFTLDILTSQEAYVRKIMQEVVQTAVATGHVLAPDIIDINISSTYAMPPYKTSMLLDFEAGRPMETEAILGNAVRAGHRENVACPYLESIYAMMQLKTLEPVTRASAFPHT
jgi:2-dehydropantoate 2-reductase